MHTDTLVNEYLHIVNQALGEHADEFPYAQVLGAADKLLGDRRVRMEVYSSDPDQPHDYFIVTLDDGKLEMIEQGKAEADLTWRVPRDHVEAVVDEPGPFIERPERLDLDWLKRHAA